MRLRRPVSRYVWEARLLYSCLGALCLLGDWRHLAAWWLAWLAELGGLRGLGRLCGLRGLQRLRGLAFGREALELGEKRKERSQSLLRTNNILPQPSRREPLGRPAAGHLLWARPPEGALTRQPYSRAFRIEGSGERSPVPYLLTHRRQEPPRHPLPQ